MTTNKTRRVISALILPLLLLAVGCDSAPVVSSEATADDVLVLDDLEDVAGKTAFARSGGSGMVRSIVNAPIVPYGDVVGRVTDLVINLDTSMDPNVPGRALLAGKTIKVTLPEAFVNSQDLPLMTALSPPDCVPGNLQCNTVVLLEGWPQHPVAAPPPLEYDLSYEGPNTIVITAREDLLPNPPLVPGIKQIHLILNSFTNPLPGRYPIEVTAETGSDGAVERGTGTVRILLRGRPSINVTSVFNAGAPNTIYQAAAPGELVPLPYDFLLWDKDGKPLDDVTLATAQTDSPHRRVFLNGFGRTSLNHLLRFTDGLLLQGEHVVGYVLIEAPTGATGFEVFTEEPSSVINAPILGVPTGHLRVFFKAGLAPGTYVLTFRLYRGNAAQMVVHVNG